MYLFEPFRSWFILCSGPTYTLLIPSIPCEKHQETSDREVLFGSIALPAWYSGYSEYSEYLDQPTALNWTELSVWLDAVRVREKKLDPIRRYALKITFLNKGSRWLCAQLLHYFIHIAADKKPIQIQQPFDWSHIVALVGFQRIATSCFVFT